MSWPSNPAEIRAAEHRLSTPPETPSRGPSMAAALGLLLFALMLAAFAQVHRAAIDESAYQFERTLDAR